MNGISPAIQSRLIAIDRTIETLETPAVLIDAAIAEANLVRWQKHSDVASLANRPHIKTHRTVAWALRQLELGAKGITVQTVGEAEVMVEAGVSDIFLTTNVLGSAKLSRLAELAKRCRISVVADSMEVVDGLAAAAASFAANIRVLIECETGGGRCGVSDPSVAVAIARRLGSTEGLSFGGLMTYPAAGKRREMNVILADFKAACTAAGLPAETVSAGGSPDMWSDEGLEHVTEYRAGTFIFNDRSLVSRKTASLGDCAMTVLSTVVSCPTPDRAIIDAGSKALTSDLLGLDGYGLVVEHQQAKIYQLNEEHGYLDVARCATKPRVGDRIHIIPNHTCVVSNLFDKMHIVADGKLAGALPVDARGRSA
jgi:D-serine deaminase-like pyridoxal phosphate-dependent protein